MIPSSCIAPIALSPFPTRCFLIRPQTLTLNPHRRLCLHKPHRRPPKSLSSPSPFAAAASASVDFEESVDKDWSFLDAESDEDGAAKADRIISAGSIGGGSRVLVSMGSEKFVDLLVRSAPCELVVAIHESVHVLAGIKEEHDEVRCWLGGIDAAPERFAPYGAAFLCYLPGMGISLDQALDSLAERCSPGARLVICFEQGREIIQQHRELHPDVVTSDLPDRTALQKAAGDHSLQIVEFVDDPTFYLAVLRLPLMNSA